ncbi:MAG: S-ribosylhomocysteine lyase [Clostridia bacterium]|nr:S-ribosylhomocysteine lyase [Clostridia bacterium]
MERIKSFTVDHMTLLPGVYVSREDRISYDDAFGVTAGDGEKENISEKGAYPVTTYDIRMTRPNFEPVMGTGEIHAIEHLGATYLRNREDIKSRVIYWGPMGCRTGFYLILSGAPDLLGVTELMVELYSFIASFQGDIPGASPEECGNYSDMDPQGARERAAKYLEVLKAL